MAHVSKYNANACGHLFKHYERSKNEQGEYINFGNENIDISKTHLNYNLAEDKSQFEFLKKRTSEVKCLKRKDVNVMCSWVVTKPKDLPNDLEQSFFKSTYKFLENKYKKENVISSYVHLDEVTPHMHFAFIPVTLDKKKNIEKVSAKEVITRSDLKSFHKDLEIHLERELGVRVNVLNEVTREGNKSIKELKRGTAINRLQELEKQLRNINTQLAPLKAEYGAYKAYIDQAEKNSDIANKNPEYIERVKKGLINKKEYVMMPAEKWEERCISRNHVDAVKAARKQIETVLEEMPMLKQEVQGLKNEIDLKDRMIEEIKHIINSDIELKKAFNNQILQEKKKKEKQIKIRKSKSIGLER